MYIFKTALLQRRTINGHDFNLKGLQHFLVENDLGSQLKFTDEGVKELEVDVSSSSLEQMLLVDFITEEEYHELVDGNIDFILIVQEIEMSDFRDMIIEMGSIQADAIYEEERERRAGITAWTEERHDSDEEELRCESAELRDYNDFFDMEDR